MRAALKKTVPNPRPRPQQRPKQKAPVVLLRIKQRPFAEFSESVAEFLEDCGYSDLRQT